LVIKKLTLFLFLFLFMVNIAFASNELIYKQNENVNLIVPCFNSGVLCSESTVCNITINSPNGNIILNNQQMSNDGAFHSYSVRNSSELGYYQTIVFCVDGPESNYVSFSYKITENGLLQDDLTFIIALAVIILFCIIVAINLKDHDNFFTWFKVLLLIFAGIYTFLIASFFVIKQTKIIFYTIFTGQIWVISIFFFIWLVYWLLQKFEVISK
jgi:hypothetical protein